MIDAKQRQSRTDAMDTELTGGRGGEGEGGKAKPRERLAQVALDGSSTAQYHNLTTGAANRTMSTVPFSVTRLLYVTKL